MTEKPGSPKAQGYVGSSSFGVSRTDDAQVYIPRSCSGSPKERTWQCADRITYATDICWLWKEFFWLLLIPQVCIPFGSLAMFFALLGVLIHLRHPPEDLVMEAVTALWLTGNFIWMLGDTLYDSPNQDTPWALTPLVDQEDDTYSAFQTAAVALFISGPALYFLMLTWSAVARLWYPSERNTERLWQLLTSVHWVSWSMKDFFWALNLFWPAMVCDCITLATLVWSNSVETGRCISRLGIQDVGWLVWVIANGIWLVMELQVDYDLTTRWVACAFSGLAALLMTLGITEVRDKGVQKEIALRSFPPEGDEIISPTAYGSCNATGSPQQAPRRAYSRSNHGDDS